MGLLLTGSEGVLWRLGADLTMKVESRRALWLFRLLSFGVLLFAMPRAESAQEATYRTVRFDLDLKAIGPAPSEGRLLLRSYDPLRTANDAPSPPKVIAFSVESPALTAPFPPGSRWEVSGEIPGFWVRREQFVVEEGDGILPQRLKVWPLGRITGMIQKGSVGENLPKEVVITTLAPRLVKGPSDLPRGLLHCPLDAKGGWSCELPAATFDIAISAEGYSPHYLWEVVVPANKAQNLGAIRLQTGSSVAGWIEVPGGGYQPKNCIVRLAPLVSGGDLGQAEKFRAIAREVRPAPTGFFQVIGVAPGNYSIDVHQSGFAPAHLGPIRIESGAESFIRQSIVLRRPLNIEVAVEPPLDWQERPWQVRVMRAGELGSALAYEALFEGRANSEGVVEIPAIPSGIFSIDVVDSTGQTMVSKRDVRIDGEESAKQVVSVDWIVVEGFLRRGKVPLSATLWFGGEHGVVSLRMDADQEGRFEGVLPQATDWVVEIAAEHPRLRVIRRVVVKAGSNGKAELEITIPDGRVFGRILDETDHPVEAATVALLPKDGFPLQQSSTEGGSFDFQAVPTGEFEIGATLGKGEAFSEPASFQRIDDQDLGPLEIHLRKGKVLEGTVASNLGPVAGARVSAFPLTPPMGMTSESRTQLDGSFRMNLPASVQRVELVVSSPGNSLRSFDLLVGEPVTLRLTDDGGTVRVRIPEETRGRWVLRLFQDGIEIPLFLLRSWARGHAVIPDPGVEVFPALATGEILVCLDPFRGRPDSDSDSKNEKPACARGMLSPGDVLELSPIEPAPADGGAADRPAAS